MFSNIVKLISSTTKDSITHIKDPGELQVGDHIYTYHAGGIYSHHGIVSLIRNDEIFVIHFFGGSVDPKDARIRLTTFETFMRGATFQNAFLVKYGVSQLEYNLKMAGSCSLEIPDETSISLIRSLSLIDLADGERGRSETPEVEYNVVMKNCELFCLWAKLGDRSGVKNFKTEWKTSEQSNPWRLLKAVGVAAVVAGSATVPSATTEFLQKKASDFLDPKNLRRFKDDLQQRAEENRQLHKTNRLDVFNDALVQIFSKFDKNLRNKFTKIVKLRSVEVNRKFCEDIVEQLSSGKNLQNVIRELLS